MTEPLPCPFCGHVGLSHYEGSTFRWLTTECNGCGAQCGEERINTMTMERSAAIEQAKVEAIKTWNTRFTPFPPQQQAEPVAREGFNNWWNGDYDDSANRFEKDSAAYWAWAGWQAAQRPWVGLTDEEFHYCIALKNTTAIAEEVEAKLKERNA